VHNTDWLKGTVELSNHGEIVVDAKARPRRPAFLPPATARRLRSRHLST